MWGHQSIQNKIHTGKKNKEKIKSISNLWDDIKLSKMCTTAISEQMERDGAGGGGTKKIFCRNNGWNFRGKKEPSFETNRTQRPRW